MYQKHFLCQYKRESAYFNLLRILKFDNMFLFKIATFTYKVINEKDNLPSVHSDFISLASSYHAYNTRFASKQNFSRPNARTNFWKIHIQVCIFKNLGVY
jgi:hypothetical protein